MHNSPPSLKFTFSPLQSHSSIFNSSLPFTRTHSLSLPSILPSLSLFPLQAGATSNYPTWHGPSSGELPNAYTTSPQPLPQAPPSSTTPLPISSSTTLNQHHHLLPSLSSPRSFLPPPLAPPLPHPLHRFTTITTSIITKIHHLHHLPPPKTQPQTPNLFSSSLGWPPATPGLRRTPVAGGHWCCLPQGRTVELCP